MPDIISEDDIKEDQFYQVHDVLVGQLKNLEEQVLHNIAQEKKIASLTSTLAEQDAVIKAQEEKLARLEQMVDKLLSKQ